MILIELDLCDASYFVAERHVSNGDRVAKYLRQGFWSLERCRICGGSTRGGIRCLRCYRNKAAVNRAMKKQKSLSVHKQRT